jgi:putative SOS response-associated peptidase YedK
MCTLYAMTKSREAVRALFRISDNRASPVMPNAGILPTDMAPVVRLAADGERELVNLSWGFVRRDPGKAPRRVVNTRDDMARSSPFWRGSFEERRCLVPVTAYSEPKGVKPATWHWFTISDDDPRPLFAFAGVWRRYVGPVKKDGLAVEIDVFSFLTTTPNALTATINDERMPVLLTAPDFDQWLHGSPEAAFSLVRPYPEAGMRVAGAGLERRDVAGAMPGG